MSLVVYKSSAGSGKTTTLVNEYLSLALVNPNRFGNIIALTFTIKATSEMKERVFVVLNKIINLDENKKDAGLASSIEHIQAATKLSEVEIRNRSKSLLHNILHNYTEFSFSTIDSFVINIVRSFAHDLNLPFDFNIELDSSLLIEKAIALLFEKIGEDEKLTRFLIQYILQNVDKESSLKIENELAQLGKIIFESRHYESVKRLNDIDLNHFSEINNTLKKDISSFETRIANLAEKGINLINNNGIEYADFSSSTIPKQFEKLKEGIIIPLHKVIIDPENKPLYAKSKKQVIKDRIDSVRVQLFEIINSINDLVTRESINYIDKKLILEKLNPLALLSEIKRMLDRYKEENNVIHLSESNKMISDIVLNEHIPFIYERVGRKYLHYLIDEFQDTSVIQWNNLIPLIDNSLATNNFNMIVGDAKQSIYRWRDGDVDQFINLPTINNANRSPILKERAATIARNYEAKYLKHNWRSELNIIEFNNEFFKYMLSHQFGSKDNIYTLDDSERIKKIYESHEQIAGKQDDNGKVIIQNYPKDGDQSYEDGLISHIELLLSQNYKLQDIAVIARTKKVLANTSSILIQHGYKVVSNETLFIMNNPQVNLISSIIHYVGNNNRKNNLLNINHLLNTLSKDTGKENIQNISSSLSHIGINDDIKLLCDSISKYGYYLESNTLLELQAYDLAEYLIQQLDINCIPNPFVQSLLNNILENSKNNGSGIQSFLEFWENKKENLSISLPENINAIKLYTIHKAKGLEFPVVIFPANGFSKPKGGFHWIDPKIANISELETAMINHKKDVLQSSFGEKFLDEEDKIKMDEINLIYVTNTRPTEQLIILFEDNRNSIWEKFKDFSIDNPKYISKDENLKIYGSIKERTEDHNLQTENEFRKILSNSWSTKIQLKQDTSVNLNEEQNINIERGKIIHEMLSNITTKSDIKKVIQSTILKGQIGINESDYYHTRINNIINNDEIKDFFHKDNDIINEQTILLPNGKQLRPDKIILRKDETLIIDYKLSNLELISKQEKQKHHDQLIVYQKLLTEMHYPNVSAHLIYIEGNKNYLKVPIK